jgi:hypothetical protein
MFDMSQVSSGGIEAAEPKFTDLLTPDSSPESDPQTHPEIDATAAAQPAGDDADARQHAQESQSEDRSPFIPRQRFDEVNTERRTLKEWRDKYAWAEGLQPEAVQTMREWFGRAAADPRTFALNLLDELTQSPEHAAAVRSELARRLGTRPQQGTAEKAAPEAMVPEVVITDAQGQEVGRTYSDRQIAALKDQIREQTLAEVDTRYADKFSVLDQFQKREQAAQAEQQAQAFATSFISELSQQPLFAEHKAAIGEYLQAHPPTSDHPAEVRANAYRAYLAVVGPKLGAGQQTSQNVLADLQRKARASTGVNPGAASSASPKSPSSFFDKDLQW